MSFGAFLKACEKLKPLSIGATCSPSSYSYNYQACPNGATCQMKKKQPTKTTPGQNTYVTASYSCVKNVALTGREKAQVENMFKALDPNHDHKISRTELADLLHVASDQAQTNNDHNLYLAI